MTRAAIVFLAAVSIASWAYSESAKTEPADTVKASEAVTANGLEIVVRPTAASFDEGKPLTFTVTLKNTTEKDMSLGDLPLWERWRFAATDKNGKTFNWVCQGMRKILIRAELAAGKTLDVNVHLADVFTTEAADVATPPEKMGGKGGLIAVPPGKREGKPLAAGTYQMVITIDRTGYKEPTWNGKLVTKPVEFAITAAGAADTGAAGEGKWIALSKDEKWYQEKDGKEQVFTGTLEANAGSGKPRLGGRSSPYMLGDHKVYSKKIQILDDLVGKKVEIRGKEVNFGKWGKEVWPAEIREAK
jgi:hypothetical protein